MENWREIVGDYNLCILDSIPSETYEGLLSIFILSTVIALAIWGCKRGIRICSCVLLFEYIYCLYCFTVFYRPISAIQRYDFHPFWSYMAIMEGRTELISEHIMNVLVFVPIGFLFGMTMCSLTFKWVVIFGGIISLGIEVLQFIMCRGFSEIDDMMHNVLGCLLGYWGCSIIRIAYEKFSKSYMGLL